MATNDERNHHGGHFAQTDVNKAVLRYRSPRSGRITTMVPSFISFAFLIAAHMAAPLLMPTNKPSSKASLRVVLKASSSSTFHFSSKAFGLKIFGTMAS